MMRKNIMSSRREDRNGLKLIKNKHHSKVNVRESKYNAAQQSSVAQRILEREKQETQLTLRTISNARTGRQASEKYAEYLLCE
ncbi:hypothetical protein Ga0466249_004337 [Sporomusaceae bacterium BoRhaA]|uniref:hypothetical protein n=1 Tax=Pelorhabdus rhamnosifermentans TaxID=2772457 RepID=UPI001C05F46C|nr:hypothetical protein [Pelorhabdus rhamnosifermentans]MBU2703201.1 hypothetical protein [Pelorhabdus rhamnosifermentans]